VGGLVQLDARLNGREGSILVDTYVDRTFHWGDAVMQTAGITPYRSRWVGFVHHTFDTKYSKYNVNEMFRNLAFRESLKCCAGLLVLSNYLRMQLIDRLNGEGFSDVPVFMLRHPTQLDVCPMFSMQRFMANPDKKVVQIGAWLRNSYAIYELPLAPHWRNRMRIRKCALRGKDMSNYYREPGMFNRLFASIASTPRNPASTTQENTGLLDGISRDSVFENKYVQGMFDMLWHNDASVEVVSHLSDAEYDALLAENIVFLNLVDASACNTVIECIARGTILLVNRHPAIEEVLGTNYPGFYENLVDAAFALDDITRLYAAHDHMRNLDKHMLKLDTFITSFQNIVRGM
jgi:hypothetical protein